MLSSACYALGLLSLLVMPPGNVLANIPTNFVTGFMAASFTALIRAMVADVSDDIRLSQGKERSGVLYALITSTSKVALASAIIITYPVLERLGYQPALGPKNSAAAIDGLTVAFLAGPIGFLALGAACFIGYRLTAERAAEIRRQLDERDAKLAG
jgi:Na+/melibiose symporter-like transporter